MGYIHSVLLILSGVAYALLLFDIGAPSGTAMQAVRLSLISMSLVLWGSLFLSRNPKTQLRFLNTIQILIVLLLVSYYFLLWNTGILDQWFNSAGGAWGWILTVLAPILGYVLLSGSVRVLARNLRKLSRVDRLRD